MSRQPNAPRDMTKTTSAHSAGSRTNTVTAPGASTGPNDSKAPLNRIHLALVGFMGSGKTSVGMLLAKHLGLTFVDLDEVISQAAGKSVTEIFRDHGEVVFRARERAAMRDVLDSEKPLVIATGGGTFVDDAMRKRIKEVARTIFLKASPDALAARIATGAARAQRPLLSGPDPLATIHRLLAERTRAYEDAEIVVPTDGRSLQDVVNDIARILRQYPVEYTPVQPTTVSGGASMHGADAATVSWKQTGDEPVLVVPSSGGPYNIIMRAHNGPWLQQTIADVCPSGRIALISDTTVGPLHARALASDLQTLGKKVSLHTVPAGEGSKSIETAGELFDQLLSSGFTRSDTIIAVGGGVVGDLAGFVASTILRGVRFVQIPTTTLAAVDSSVGGKTAVNTRHGKNLVGTFYPPKAVLVCGAFLTTQTAQAHSAGLVEALKMAATMDSQLFHDIVTQAAPLLRFDMGVLLPILARAVALKAQIVARDEKETGDRAVLNFGHTLGHAIETGEAYRMLHGETVALGMVAESELAAQEGWSSIQVLQQLTEGLHALHAPIDWRNYHFDMDALALDKKRDANSVRLPFVPTLGSFAFHNVPLATLNAFVTSAVEVDFAESTGSPPGAPVER